LDDFREVLPKKIKKNDLEILFLKILFLEKKPNLLKKLGFFIAFLSF